MSGITLSASVRQNLLALQSTASLLAKTQNDLATGNKVNTALDNPTEFFTAQSLNNRAGDIARNRSPTRCCRARRVTPRNPT
jgi:flagellin